VVFNNKVRVLFLMMLFLGSCATQDEQVNKKPLLSDIDKVLTDSLAHNKTIELDTASLDDITNALVPSINLNIPNFNSSHKETNDRFDIKVNRVNAKQFFMELVDGTPMNMVLHPDISGRISLSLKNVNVSEVMNVIRDVFGYDFVITNNTYQVYPNIMRTKIFKVNYLNINREGDSQMRVSSGQVSEVNKNNSNSTNAGSTKDTTRERISGSRVYTLYKSDFWNELEKTLNLLLVNKENRSVVVNAQSGIVVVRALSSELRIIEKYLKRTELSIHRQVILETKILEVELSDSYQTGINWASLHQTANDRALFGVTGGGSIFDNGTSIIDGNTGNLNPSALVQVDNTATSAFGGVFSLALNIGSNFAAFIELLKSQGEVKVLSSPRISTLNNQKAVIKVGVDEFFITDISSNTNNTATSNNTENDIEFTPFFSGVALDVIPQISDDGVVILHIHPTVSLVKDKIKSVDISGGQSLNIPLAISTIRETDSIIRARDGQVVVIGGLMQNSIQNQVASVPFFGDLPFIGGLFKHTRKVSKKSELVILVRPRIVKHNQDWNNQIRDSQNNFNNVSIR